MEERKGIKRKNRQSLKKNKRKKVCDKSFIKTEANKAYKDDDNDDHDGDDNDDDDDDDDNDESDIEGLINDDSDEEESDVNYYRAFENLRNGSEPVVLPSQPTTSNEPPLSAEIKICERYLKKSEICLKGLYRYIQQHTVLGFNSQKYDLLLIKKYLPSSLIKLGGYTPRQVIKRGKGYMVIATQKLKFLDITNYLAAGTSLANFYASFNVSTPKGSFPYQWFSSLEKLKETSLPQRADNMKQAFNNLQSDPNNEEYKKRVDELRKNDPYYSILKDKTISNEDVEQAEETWKKRAMTSFSDYV